MLIVSNWKAYVTDKAEAQTLFSLAKRLTRRGTQAVLAPSAPLLGALAARNTSKVAFAAQDVGRISGGAFTGEIPASVYAVAGATYAIIGHSERRAAGDTLQTVTDKLARSLQAGLIPILCVGEPERDSDGRYLALIREQLTSAVEDLTPKERSRIIIAYEPIWAIGKTADDVLSPSDIHEMVLYVQKVLAELPTGNTRTKVKVIYGGSVESDNVQSIVAESGVDGLLIGHASANPRQYRMLVEKLS